MTDGAPTTGDLAGRLKHLSPEKLALLQRWIARPDAAPDAIAPADRGADLPLSFAQERLWFLDRFEPGTPVYNMYLRTPLPGVLNRPALERALAELVRRHEALRTVFRAGAEGRPVQVVLDPAPLALPVSDLSALPPERRAEEADRVAVEEWRRPFDLAEGPLVRVLLVRRAAWEHELVLTIHHIVSDGWSLRVFFRELGVLYDAFAAGRPSPLPPLPLQYADFAAWQRRRLEGDGLDRQLAYWRGQLAGAPSVLPLPADRARPPAQSFRGGLVSFHVPPAVADGVHALAQRTGTTVFMALLAAFSALLHRLGAGTDVVVGTPIANRQRAELEGLIGFFANTLVLRADASGDPPFQALLGRVRETTLAAYANQDLPFEKLVEELQPTRHLGHNPLFQVMFLLQSLRTSAAPGGSAGEDDPRAGDGLFTGTAKFDLMLGMTDADAGMGGTFEYGLDLFDAATVERMAAQYVRLLAAAAADPLLPLSALPVMGDDERAAVLHAWNDTAAPLDADGGVPALFDAAADAAPHAVALAWGGGEVTYAELRARADRLASRLVAAGVGPERVVGICAGRGPELVVALLAAWKAGGACLAIDPAHPAARIDLILRDARADVVLATEALRDAVPAGRTLIPIDRIESIDGIDRNGGTAQGDEDGGAPSIAIHSDHLAYVVYTSGSTGTPKGVAMPHGPLCSLIAWQNGVSTPGPRRTLQWTAPTFDVAFQEIASTLAAGGTLVMAPDADRADPAALADALSAEGIERVFLPFVALAALAEELAARPRPLALREVVTAGEALRVGLALVEAFAAAGCALHNQYGPSETHVVTAHALPGAPEAWPALPPIGRPVANARAYVLDAALEPAPLNVPGELHLGGAMQARGYLGDPARTAERFVPDPFAPAPGGRMYRTGDVARWRADGTLEFLGRADDQAKVRGVRVEPGEVEAALDGHPAVAACAAAARPGPGGEARLCAWIVPRPGAEVDAAEVRAWLRARLPEALIPSVVVPVDTLPRTATGKVDRRALPVPAAGAGTARHVAPRTALEEVLAGIWAEVLEAPRVGVEDDFFDLGGHSLLVTQVVSRIRDVLGADATVRGVFEHPTVGALAAALARAPGEAERLERAAGVVLEIARMPEEELAAAEVGG